MCDFLSKSYYGVYIWVCGHILRRGGSKAASTRARDDKTVGVWGKNFSRSQQFHLTSLRANPLEDDPASAIQ